MRPRPIIGALRRRLPDGAEERVRALALRWGILTAPLRLTPDILVVGAQRSGTTTLFRLLAEHPALVRPTLTKGTGYFDDAYERGARWYRAHFPLRWTARLLVPRGVRPRTFECSGYYLFHPLAAERIARDLPDVRVVVMLRDPVERARSAHRHERARGFERLEFDEAMLLEDIRLRGEEERLRDDPHYRSFEHRHHAYLGRSCYAPQVKRLVDLLGPDRVMVVDAEDFFTDPQREFLALQRWLDLPLWRPEHVEVANARPASPLAARRHAQLLRFFDRSDDELAQLTGRVPAWRRTTVRS